MEEKNVEKDNKKKIKCLKRKEKKFRYLMMKKSIHFKENF